MKVAEAKERILAVREALCTNIPEEHQEWFMDRITVAVVNYLEETPPSTITKEIKALEKAMRETPGKAAEMIEALSPGTYSLLCEHVDMPLLGELRNRDTDELDVELLRPIIMASERIRKEGDRKRRIRKTVGSLSRGRPPATLESVLVSRLASALAGATGKPTTGGTDEYISPFMELVEEVLTLLHIDDPQDGGFSALKLVTRHIVERQEQEVQAQVPDALETEPY
jgi:hypothetical protein